MVQDFADGSTNPIRWEAFKRATWEYMEHTHTAKMLNALWASGYSPERAIAFVRERGAVTKAERTAAWQARLDGWAANRKAKNQVTGAQVKAQIAGAILKVLGKLEGKELTGDAREIVEAVKRQVLGS